MPVLNTPARIVVALGMIILASELLIMLLVDALQPIFKSEGPISWEFIDPIVLAAFVFPVLYALVFRPMRDQQAELKDQLDVLRRNEQLTALIEAIPDAVFLKDGEGRWQVINEPAKQLFQLHNIPWQGKSEMELAELQPAFRAVFERCQASDEIAWQSGQLLVNEDRVVQGDGQCVVIEARRIPTFGKHGRRNGLVIIGRDISERQASAARIERLVRLYRALSEINQAIVRMDDESDLFPLVCKIAVDFGGLKLAWIGSLTESNGLIESVASYGDVGYLKGLVISSTDELPEGQGPTGTAFRENREVIANRFQVNGFTAPWHERALRHGFGANAAFPIRRAGKPFAVLTLYHAHPEAFDVEMIALLSDMSHSISFALDSFDREIEHKKAEGMLSRLGRALDESSSEICMFDAKTLLIVLANAGARRNLGYSMDELRKLTPLDLKPKLTAEAFERIIAPLRRGEMDNVVFETENQRKNKSLYPVEINLQFYAKESTPVFFAIIQDLTERKQAEGRRYLAASVFTHSYEGILITGTDGLIVDANDAFTRITGYKRDEVMGQNPRLLSSGRQDKAFYTAMWHDLIENGHWHGEIWNRRKNGEVYAEMLSINGVRDAQGYTRHYVALFSDITSLKEHQSQLEHLAHYDILTSLPNRALLTDRLRQSMAQALRRRQHLAVVYLDLDGFKAVNDKYGHGTGDQLLMTVATLMKQALREGDTFARLGGDEFVAILLDLADIEVSMPMIARLLAAAAQPVHVGDFVLQVSASIGVAFYPQVEDVDADQLLRQADQAMYQAKLAGKNRYHVFDVEQDRSVRSHLESLSRMSIALSEREFVLHYQPKVNMRTGTIIGAEALIRWQHPERGLLPPAMFLPIIEDHPLSIKIGEWVIDTALRQMALWRAADLDMPVSVNVSARQMQHPDFVARLRELLVAHPDVRPGDLELEVLETSALEDLSWISQVIEACRQIGVMFALDDFGTGYSSLTYLKRLPITQLKIDQSFVRDMLGDPEDLAILDGVIGLAAAFRRQVIAEGVETVEHGAMLLQLGCELAQGYGIARPMPAQAMADWCATWRPDPSWRNLRSANRDDLPLLFAGVEHRAWIAAIENRFRGEPEIPVPLDPHQCRFGKWLDTSGQTRYGMQPAFDTIVSLHLRVHALAVDLLEQQAQGQSHAARARLSELHGLRDALLEQLKTLGSRSAIPDFDLGVPLV